MENKTLTPEWERYYADMKQWKENCEKKKPQRSGFDTEEEYQSALTNWDFGCAMDEPNKPGYFRANND